MVDVNLYKNVDLNFTNTVYCTNNDEKLNYLSKYFSVTVGNCTIKNLNTIKLRFYYTDMTQYNYIHFKFDNMDYYGFIDAVEFKNIATQILHITIDWLFTYIDKIHISNCFLERITLPKSQLNDENNIANGKISEEIPLNLETYHVFKPYTITNMVMVVNTTIYETNIPIVNGQLTTTNLVSDTYFSYVILNNTGFYNWLENINSIGQTNEIINISLIPLEIIFNNVTAYNQLKSQYPTAILARLNGGFTSTINVPIYGSDAFTGYIPQNKKIYYDRCCRYLSISDNISNRMDLDLSLFDKTNINGTNYYSFNLLYVPSPENAIQIVPSIYNGINNNIDKMFTLTNIPQIPFTIDNYKLWLAKNKYMLTVTQHYNNENYNLQNKIATDNYNINNTTTGISALGNILDLNFSGLANNTIDYISNNTNYENTKLQNNLNYRQTIDTMQAQIASNQVGNIEQRGTCSSLSTFCDMDNIHSNILSFNYVSCNAHDAENIDITLTRYGYRRNNYYANLSLIQNKYTYIKTSFIDIDITGGANHDIIDFIETIFNNGVTIWTNDIEMYNYNANFE